MLKQKMADLKTYKKLCLNSLTYNSVSRSTHLENEMCVKSIGNGCHLGKIKWVSYERFDNKFIAVGIQEGIIIFFVFMLG
jgi:hypothetical protein